MAHSIPSAVLFAFLVLLAGPSAAQVKKADPPARPQPGPDAVDDDALAALPKSAFAGRTGATRARLVKAFGGNEASELAVERGLAWIAKQQMLDGRWLFDGSDKDEITAAVGLAVLPFLGAGHGHKQGKYQKTVKGGVDWLIRDLKADGKFASGKTMYAQAIGTLALVECYGLTKDRAVLRPAQLAVNYIQKGQGKDGSWGYQAGTNGDTSILGWQVQVLKAAQLAGDIPVDAKVVAKAVAFLDKVGGEKKATYGYSAAPGVAGTSLTAIGLWCRAAVDGWQPDEPALAEGVAGLVKRSPLTGRLPAEAYFLYYATQAARAAGGDAWKNWNEGPLADGKRSGGVRDVLVQSQNAKDGPTLGSWDRDTGFMGMHCGRLGTTALSVLTLEAYYRYPPLPQK